MFFNINRTFYASGISGPGHDLDEPTEERVNTVNKLVAYVMETPHNINPAVLIQLIRDLDTDDLNALRGTSEQSELDDGLIPKGGK